MTKQILVSCLAATFLLSGAAIAPSWANTADSLTSGKYLFADGDENQNEQAPQEEQEGGDREGNLILNGTTSFDVAQSEEGASSEPQQPEEGQGGEGGEGGGD